VSASLPSYPCPCCGYISFDELDSFDTCSVCGWEDDVSQLRFPSLSGANRPLLECQREFVVSARARTAEIEAPRGTIQRDPHWRPLDPETDHIEVSVPGIDYGTTYPEDLTDLYYWRRSQD
jgi:Cysteine-rich CPCC